MRLYIKVHGRIVFVAKIKADELNEALHKLSAQPVQGIAYETGLNMPWGEGLNKETKDLIEYAKQNRKEFWCVSEDQPDTKIARLPTLDKVWMEFHKYSTKKK